MLNKIKFLYKKIKSSKDGCVIVKNFCYLSLLQMASYLFPLFTIPYLARIIGVEGFGKIAFASAIMLWFQTIVNWGFNFTATRDVAQYRYDNEAVSRIFSSVLWARVLLSIISALILFIITLFVPVCFENRVVICFSFLMIPGHVLFPDWFFQAIEKMQYVTVFNIVIKLLFTLAVFVCIKEKDDYVLQPLLLSLGYIISGIGAMFIIVRKWHYKLFPPTIHDTIKTIKNSSDVFFNSMFPNIYNSFSIILLGQFSGGDAVGIFEGGNKILSVFYPLQNILSRVFFPFLSRHPNQTHFFSKINLFLGCVVVIILLLFAPLITHIILGQEFENSVIVLRILAISYFFLVLSNTYGQNYLIITYHEKELRNITMLSSLLGILVAVPMVYYFSYVGVAITILICRMLIGVLSSVVANRYMKR